MKSGMFKCCYMFFTALQWKHPGDQDRNVTDSPFYKPFLNVSPTVSEEEA